MVSGKIVIVNQTGLNVKSAGALVKLIQPYNSEVTLNHKNKQFNAKSVLGIISACIQSGEEVEFVCEGSDEVSCLHAIEKALRAGL